MSLLAVCDSKNQSRIRKNNDVGFGHSGSPKANRPAVRSNLLGLSKPKRISTAIGNAKETNSPFQDNYKKHRQRPNPAFFEYRRGR
jgi:hypothetical protein